MGDNQDRNHPEENRERNPRLVTAKELAESLRVPISWIYQRTWRGSTAIPHVKLGKYVRFDVAEVLAFFRSGSGRTLET